jgi:predicted acyl esterase
MHDVLMDENVFITMRDGIKIAVDIHRPDAPGRFPALFSMSPYGKEKQRYPESVVGVFTKVEAGNTRYFVSKGYVHVIADSRGSSPSEGQWNLLDKEEQQDGFELIEWIAKQPWCDGQVAMIGESYYAVIQYLVAATQPPSLKTIVPYDGFSDLYRDVVYQGGIYNAGFLGYWFPSVYESCLPQNESQSPKWLPPKSACLETVLSNTDGPYYWERSSCTKFDKIKIPIYHMAAAGHYAHYRGQLDAYQSINSPKKLLVGPAPPFEMFYHPALCKQILRWLDYWLKGIDTGIMEEPPITIYLTGASKWRYEYDYPLERTQWTKLYLRQGENGTASSPPYGDLSNEKPDAEDPETYDFPESQRKVAADAPVLAFSTPPLAKDMEIVGPACLVLYASSTADDMNWVVKIDDIAPDNSFKVVTKGWLKAAYREVDEAKSSPGRPFHPHEKPKPIEKNKIYKYEIELWPIFRTFKAGHRLRLRIASGDSFGYDVLNYHSILFQPASNTVYHDKDSASYLVIPVIPFDDAIRKLKAPEINYKI